MSAFQPADSGKPTEATTSYSGAEIIVKILEQQGIEIITGMPGGAALPLYDALRCSEKVRHVLARHEQGAGFVAQGMSRVLGTPQVCLATSGPGATNLLTAVADARLDSIPLVAITGQVPQQMIGTDAFQEVDTYGLSLPITKHNFLVRSAAELLEVMPEAFRIAASGRPGPVWIDVPKDVQVERIVVDQWPAVAVADAPPAVVPTQIEEAAAMINASERPVLYVGGGAVSSVGAAEKLRKFSDDNNLHAVSTLMGLGVLDTEDPKAMGMLGMHGALFTHSVLDRTDLLIVVGARFDDRATGKVAEFCPQAKVIHIDIDPSELSKLKHAHIAIVGDVATSIDALAPLVDNQQRTEWADEIADYRARMPLQMPDLDKPTSPYGIIKATYDAAGPEAIVTTDVGQHQMWAAQAYPFNRPRQWLTSGGLGTMGFGLPAAIGAAIAAPDKPVICFTGDGSILLNMQEMATLVEERLNVKIVLLDNTTLGLVHQQQSMFYGSKHFASSLHEAPDFSDMARAFGIPAWNIGNLTPDVALPTTILKLTVRNHSGTLSHVAGLFSRRAFNLEAVLVLPQEGTDNSLMWLKVAERKRLGQVISQLQKLEDVLQLEPETEGNNIFERADSAVGS